MGTQVPVAARVKQEVGLPTIALGLITQPVRAETILNRGEADAIAPARGMLYDPRSPWHASAEPGAENNLPPRVSRLQPLAYKTLFKNAKIDQRQRLKLDWASG